MATIRTAIELDDKFTSALNNIINAVNMSVSVMEQMQTTVNTPVDPSAFDGVRDYANQATVAVQELNAALQDVEPPAMPTYTTNIDIATQQPDLNIPESATVYVTPVVNNIDTEKVQIPVEAIVTEQPTVEVPDSLNVDVVPIVTEQPVIDAPEQIEVPVTPVITEQLQIDVPDPIVEQPEPVEVPIHWQSDTMDIFTNSGVERFEQEIQSANNMLNTLNHTQTHIAETAAQTNIFPPNMVTDMNGIQSRLQAIRQKIQTIENNPLNMGSDVVNAELEQLRGQLDQAVQEQEMLNSAVERMDVGAANQAYLRLSQTIGDTERYIRDNVDEQENFNSKIKNGIESADMLKKTIQKAVSAFAGIAGIKKTFDFVMDCFDTFNVQLNAENQLMEVLSNTYNNAFDEIEMKLTADASAAIDTIDGVQSSVEGIEIPAYVRTSAANAAFDKLTAKASEIQSRGIYGDETMIAAAAELSTYFTDTNAIEMMMDTLTDYAMGMEGGVTSVSASAMVNYATNLGKMMSGAYDAMTKKDFELSDEQKAIIKGTATQAQIVSALGEEYVNMSKDMQAAAAISQVIEENWGGLYENMSNTAAGSLQQMDNLWGNLKETVGERFAPVIQKVVDVVLDNWDTVENIIDSFAGGLEKIADKLPDILQGAADVFDFFNNNWSLIAPIISTVAGAMIAYKIATGLAEVAQKTFNTTLSACPIFWIITAIILLITAFCALWDNCEGFRKFMVDMWAEQTKALGRFYNDVVVPIANAIIPIQNDIREATKNFCISTVNSIADMAKSVIENCDWIVDGIRNMINMYNSVVSAWGGQQINADFFLDTKNIDAMRDEAISKIESIDVLQPSELLRKLNLDVLDNMVDNMSDFCKKSTVSEIFDAYISGDLVKIAKFGEKVGKTLEEALGPEIPPWQPDGDYSKYLQDIDNNTEDIKGSLDITEEDLKYLRDIAEQETINRFTTAEITVEQHNTNNISSTMDIDGVINELTEATAEAVYVIAEGVHV